MADSAESTLPRWLTVEEVAEMLGLSTNTVRRQLREGEIPGRKFGRQYRIPLSALEDLSQGTAGAA